MALIRAAKVSIEDVEHVNVQSFQRRPPSDFICDSTQTQL